MLSGLITIAFAGCEKGPAIAPVTGIVTHDGKPIADAEVMFQPDKGAPAYAHTDAEGKYDLKYQRDRRGALLGHHFVGVSTKGEFTDTELDITRTRPETIPRKFNEETELEFTVKKGDNVFNINVEGKRERGFDRGF